MTFDSLKHDMQAYLERGTVVDSIVYAQLPSLINFAERRIARELKVQGFQRAVTTTLEAGMPVYPKPDRWRETISVNVQSAAGSAQRQPIFPRSYEYCRSYWPSEAETGQPLFYADYGYTNWLIVPTPSAALSMEVVYYELPPLLDETNQTNWLTEYAPQLLLYGALLEAAPFLKDDERIGVWQSMYDRAAQALKGEDLQKMTDRSSTRTGA